MKSQKGFSLIELLIVVVIIAIVAAIAVPNLISSRRAANEGSTVSALRTIFGANVSFAATVGNGRYAGTPGTADTSGLAELYSAGLVDDVIGSGYKSGFSIIGDLTAPAPPDRPTFYFAANPTITSGILMTGTKRFGIATDGVIRQDSVAANIGIPFDATTLATAIPMNNP